MGLQGELRNKTILAIEERISELLSVMHETMNRLTEDGLPDQRHTLAYAEWRILKDTSTSLQEISADEYQFLTGEDDILEVFAERMTSEEDRLELLLDDKLEDDGFWKKIVEDEIEPGIFSRFKT